MGFGGKEFSYLYEIRIDKYKIPHIRAKNFLLIQWIVNTKREYFIGCVHNHDCIGKYCLLKGGGMEIYLICTSDM